MSTTFDAYPKLARIPSFAELLDLSTRRLQEFLHEFGIPASPTITAELRTKEPDVIKPLDLSAPLTWPDDHYAWFRVPPADGGTDAYLWAVDELVREMWADQPPDIDPHMQSRRHLVRRCLENGYFWNFRRSMGQPAIIAVAYGMITASLAELTAGFVYSEDGAWDFRRFPATAEEFFTWYFRPALALDPDKGAWAARCIADLREQFGA